MFYLYWIDLGIAAKVAKKIEAKCLILNHFSQRYKPVDYVKQTAEIDSEIPKDTSSTLEEQMEDSVQKLVDEAKLTFSGPVMAAYDFFNYKLT